ncbi:WASH complex subunit 3 isoform X2 [Panthera tigris]|uniref:WASH complex subunit 3 isoform X2 n=1 Tax=Panthera tigris TaxID=9694 RepID=UPI001C6F89EE|nr:WASH complex subunit 3 isoform X2 [Panthera tigris]
MDEDGLPLMGSGIDLTKVPAIQQKRTVAFLNQFVVHTVQFLNRFSTVCEEKLADLSLRIQQIETTLNILDAKLSSIPGLDDVTFEVSTVSATGITNESHSETTAEKSQNSLQDSGPQESEVTPENILTVAKDPRYARYLKMVQVGVPVMAIRNKMISEGLDPDLLERPDAPVPDGEDMSNPTGPVGSCSFSFVESLQCFLGEVCQLLPLTLSGYRTSNPAKPKNLRENENCSSLLFVSRSMSIPCNRMA